MRPHYPMLDGLRGVAAILVLIFHICEARFPLPKDSVMHHAFLAVDFFFLLSGFVVAYAYDDRFAKGFTAKEFFKNRLIRLHPMVILATIIGAIGFYFDGYPKGMENTSIGMLLLVTLIGFTMLPAPDIRGWDETHPLDGPAWSLMQEYLANILYAWFGWKLKKTALWVLVILSGIAMIGVACWRGDLATGWDYGHLWIAPIRMLFPFFAGILLYRTGKKIRIPFAFPICALVLAALFTAPIFNQISEFKVGSGVFVLKYNGLFEAACIVIAFPLIVAAGVGSQVQGRWLKLSRFVGDVSYPLYLIHYPAVYVFTGWINNKKPADSDVFKVGVMIFICCIIAGWVAYKFYDEPVRKWLRRKVGS